MRRGRSTGLPEGRGIRRAIDTDAKMPCTRRNTRTGHLMAPDTGYYLACRPLMFARPGSSYRITSQGCEQGRGAGEGRKN
jgi:hypothetical protein